MKLKFLLAAIALSFTAQSSQAGVVYKWQGVKKSSPSMFSLTIEFDEATVRGGSYSVQIDSAERKMYNDTGLLSFTTPHYIYNAQTELFNHGMDFGYLNIDVAFINGKFMTGSIRMFDFQTRLNMTTSFEDSNDYRLFTIYDTDADYGMGDCAGPTAITCWGGTGHMRQVPVQIPEPTSIMLLAIGTLSAYSIRRRRVKSCQS